MSNITVLDALKNILERCSRDLPVVNSSSSNRANATGEQLEFFIKDSFCGAASHLNSKEEKLTEYNSVFSYLGNANNPPDFIVNKGCAVEVKKIEGTGKNGLALNSSFPKDFLYSDDPKISNFCSECESITGGWEKKDMVYAVGNIKNKKIYTLWLVYGDCYCADRSSYERIVNTIKDGVSSIPDIDFGETKELARVNRVDPLGITYLRMRGMWGIDHPSSVFSYLPGVGETTEGKVFLLISKAAHDKIALKPDFSSYLESSLLKITEEKISNPNNPAQTMDVVFYRANIDG